MNGAYRGKNNAGIVNYVRGWLVENPRFCYAGGSVSLHGWACMIFCSQGAGMPSVRLIGSEWFELGLLAVLIAARIH